MERPDPEDRISAYEFLLSDDYFRGDMNIPPRGQLRHRPPPNFNDDELEDELHTIENRER